MRQQWSAWSLRGAVEMLAEAACGLGKSARRAVNVDDLVLPRQAIAAGGEVLHVGVGAILRAAGDGGEAAVAELIDVVLDRPVPAGFAHKVGTDLRGDDLVRAAAVPWTIMVPSKLTIMPSPIESKLPSEPHMQTFAVTIRLQNEFDWLVNRQASRTGAV